MALTLLAKFLTKLISADYKKKVTKMNKYKDQRSIIQKNL